MQHPHVLGSDDVDQYASVQVPDFDETRFKGQDVRLENCKCLRITLPGYLPIWERSPTMAIDEKRKVGVTEEEVLVDAFDINWTNILFHRHKVKGCIGLVKQRLCVEVVQVDNLKPSGTANTQS